MDFYLDKENSTGNYSYATFEEAFGGRPRLILRNKAYLLIPVINQGIYDLQSFNNGSEIPIYIDYSYYFFSGIWELNEMISVRGDKSIRAHFENRFKSTTEYQTLEEFRIELEMGFNGEYLYAANWRVKAKQFGVLIPTHSKQSENDKLFFKDETSIDTIDRNFLLSKHQIHLEQFLSTLQ